MLQDAGCWPNCDTEEKAMQECMIRMCSLPGTCVRHMLEIGKCFVHVFAFHKSCLAFSNCAFTVVRAAASFAPK